MGDSYHSLSRQSVLGLLKKAYEAGCCSYLDLRDATCEDLFDEYLATEAKKDTKVFERTDSAFTIRAGDQINLQTTVATGQNAYITDEASRQRMLFDTNLNVSIGSVGEQQPSGWVRHDQSGWVMVDSAVTPEQNPMVDHGNGSEAI